MPKPEKQPPAIIAEELSPWADLTDEAIAAAGNMDPWFVSGYSDKRRDREIAVAKGERPEPLPWRFQYVRTALTSGAPDNTKPAEFSAKGYLPVLYDDAAKYGIDVKKSGFVRAPDGTCRVASQQLMVIPAAKAAVHARTQREKTRELTEGSGAILENAVDSFNARMGEKYHADIMREETLHKG